MKKILLITEHLGSGGAERQICGLSYMLTEKGYSCRLITYINNQFYEPYLIEKGVDYEYVPDLAKKRTRVFRMINYLKKYKPDIVISYLPSVNIMISIACLFYKCKLILSERNNNTCLTNRDKVQFFIYRIADYIVPNSYCQGNFIATNFPILKKRIFPIVNFVDTNYFKPTENVNDNQLLNIVTVGRYTTQKNCLNYLEAIKIVKEKGLKVHFDWYGDKFCNINYYSLVEKTVQNLEIDDYITLHNVNNNIVEIYQKADVFCLPSIYEGYPNVIVEAMSCGLPIIASSVFENPYIVKDEINGFLFDPLNVNDIAISIEKIVNLTFEERKLMGLKNRSICMSRNTINKFVQSYIQLIES